MNAWYRASSGGVCVFLSEIGGFVRLYTANCCHYESLGSVTEEFVFRDATRADVPALARLHVLTFVETHGGPGPGYELREGRWREAFEKAEGNGFCVVIARPDDRLIGFAKGVPYTHGLYGFDNELDKLYLLRE